MDSEQMRLSAGIAAVRLKTWVRLVFGAFGFLLVGYGALGLYEAHQKAQDVLALTGNPYMYDHAFTNAAEAYFLILGAGVVIVFLAYR